MTLCTGVIVLPGRRIAVFEEALTVVRRLLTEESVTFRGTFFTLDDAASSRDPHALSTSGSAG